MASKDARPRMANSPHARVELREGRSTRRKNGLSVGLADARAARLLTQRQNVPKSP